MPQSFRRDKSDIADFGQEQSLLLDRSSGSKISCELLELSHFSVSPQISQLKKNWSGWQELNLRGHVPKTCGWPLPYTRISLSKLGEGVAALSCLALHADHLAQRVNHVHQIALRFHHGVDGLVRHRRFVDNVRILTTLDARSCLGVIVQGETALRLRT